MKLFQEFNETMTAFGSGYFYILLLIILFRFNFDLAIKLLLVLIFVELISGGIKLVYHKPRPIQRKNQTIFERWDAGSFPSLHTARITAIAITLNYAFFDPIIAILSVFLVIGVGYSRIYLKHHYLIDVIAGFLIGLIIGIGGIFI